MATGARRLSFMGCALLLLVSSHVPAAPPGGAAPEGRPTPKQPWERCRAAFNAAAMDPARIAGVVYMGMESTFAGYEGKFWDVISPVHSQKAVTCPVLYLGATNEDGYQMFNIARLQAKMKRPWTIELIPNYRHATSSEVQILDWQLWIAHLFEARPLTRIGELARTETPEGSEFRARIESPNKIVLAKVWAAVKNQGP